VPALLISVATGLIVTKSTSDEGISNDLRRQIVYNPKVFFIAAGFCILLSIPLATLPFLALAALFIIVGLQLKKQSVEVENRKKYRSRRMRLRR